MIHFLSLGLLGPLTCYHHLLVILASYEISILMIQSLTKAHQLQAFNVTSFRANILGNNYISSILCYSSLHKQCVKLDIYFNFLYR